MSKTKSYETQAIHQLELTHTHLIMAIEALEKASASVDDFPTARHELSDLANQGKSLLSKLKDLKGDLDNKKTK